MRAEPQKGHEWLERLVGERAYEAEAVLAPGQPPVKARGKESVRRLVGRGRGARRMPGQWPGARNVDGGLRPGDEAVRRHLGRLHDGAPLGL